MSTENTTNTANTAKKLPADVEKMITDHADATSELIKHLKSLGYNTCLLYCLQFEVSDSHSAISANIEGSPENIGKALFKLLKSIPEDRKHLFLAAMQSSIMLSKILM